MPMNIEPCPDLNAAALFMLTERLLGVDEQAIDQDVTASINIPNYGQKKASKKIDHDKLLPIIKSWMVEQGLGFIELNNSEALFAHDPYPPLDFLKDLEPLQVNAEPRQIMVTTPFESPSSFLPCE